jgi:hypothetical protein
MITAPSTDPAAARPVPWHRERWPWLLMAGPAVVIVAGIVTVWFAVKSDDGLVADDYYRRGLAINRTLERADRAAALDLAATVDLDAEGRVRVRLTTSSSAPEAQPTALRLAILHPTHAGDDIHGVAVRGPDGDYVGELAPIAPGRWLVQVETDAWRLPTAEIDGPVRGVELRAQTQ